MLFLDAGKPVLCEKPFALNAVQGRGMVDAARAAGLFLMEAMWSASCPPTRRLVDVAGRRRASASPSWSTPTSASAAACDPNTGCSTALGGGGLLDIGIYPLQLGSLVLGPPDRVRPASPTSARPASTSTWPRCCTIRTGHWAS